jgi:DNA-binding NarL/FixJ family response regulator
MVCSREAQAGWPEVAKGAPLVVWVRDGAVREVVEEAARSFGSPVVAVGSPGEAEDVLIPPLLPHEVEEAMPVVVVEDGDPAVREFLRRVRALRPSLKVLVVAQAGDREAEVQLRSLGAHYIFFRPLSRDLFGKVLCKALEHETTRWRRDAARA